MPLDDAMSLVGGLLTPAQALAAVTARLRLDDMGVPGDPALRAQLDRVVDALDAGKALDDLSDRDRSVVLAFARSYLRQALDLMEEPDRSGAWTHSDPAILQAQGFASGVVASLFLETGIGRRGIRILDVGTGVAGLAIAFCNTFPDSTVVGLDPWEPALALARSSVAAAGLESRITLHATPIQSFEDAEGFDLVWLPSFFIPESIIDDALRATARVTRPDATAVVGTMEPPDDPLAAAVDSMMTARSGGTNLSPAEAIACLERARFIDCREVDRFWNAPIRLVSARRDGG